MDDVPGFKHVTYEVRLPPFENGREPDRHRVLIVGGGPVGLALALALAKQNVRTVVVEADRTVCTGSRAICLSRRTLEILDRLGVLEPFVGKGLPWTGGRSFYRDQQVLHFQMPHDADQRLHPMTNLQQYYIEQFLVDEVLKNPDLIDLRWGTRVTSITPAEDHVSVVLDAEGISYSADSEWLVACDGARSRVRQELDLRMRGTAYEARYVIVDIGLDIDWPTERLAWFDPPSNPGRTMLMHRQPDNVWRLDYQLRDDENAEDMISRENVVPVVTRHLEMLGIDGPWELIWATTYRASALSLQSYRNGRVLFAGDAAHLVPIFGVRGLNSGFDDVFNLAWKLAFVLAGTAPVSLLDTYTQERHGAWRTNIAQAMKSTEFMAPPSRGFSLMREAVLSLAAGHPQITSLINPRQSSAIPYNSSPLNTPDTAQSFAGGPGPGEVVPECPLRDRGGERIFVTQLLPDSFTLIVYGGSEAGSLAEAAGCAVPLGTIVIVPRHATERAEQVPKNIIVVEDDEERFAEIFDARAGTTYLVRPDGYVCARWCNPSPPDIRLAVLRALGNIDVQRHAV